MIFTFLGKPQATDWKLPGWAAYSAEGLPPEANIFFFFSLSLATQLGQMEKTAKNYIKKIRTINVILL